MKTSSVLLVSTSEIQWFLPSCLSVQSESALTVVENAGGGEAAGSDEDEEATVDEDEGDLEVVQPTEEWQTLKPGNVCSERM